MQQHTRQSVRALRQEVSEHGIHVANIISQYVIARFSTLSTTKTQFMRRTLVTNFKRFTIQMQTSRTCPFEASEEDAYDD